MANTEAWRGCDQIHDGFAEAMTHWRSRAMWAKNSGLNPLRPHACERVMELPGSLPRIDYTIFIRRLSLDIPEHSQP